MYFLNTAKIEVLLLCSVTITIYNFVAVVEQLCGGIPINVWKLVLLASVTMFLLVKFGRQPFVSYISDENEKLE